MILPRAWFCRVAAVFVALLSGCANAPPAVPPAAPPAPQVPAPPAVFEIAMPTSPSPLHLSLSPDGRQIVTWMESGNGLALWSRKLASPEAGKLPGSERARSTASGFPFWSPDGESIAMFGNRSLQVIGRNGGLMRTLAAAAFGHGGSWNRDGVIVYAPDSKGPLFRIHSNGGSPLPATRLEASRDEIAHLHPFFLPDGKHFLYLAQTRNAENTGIWVGSLDSTERTFLLHTAMKAVFVSPSTLIYVDGRTLMARPFDPERLVFDGPSREILGPVGTNAGNGAAGFSVSNNGVLAYLPAIEPSHPQKGPIRVIVNWPELDRPQISDH
jgi:hypothetical protein